MPVWVELSGQQGATVYIKKIFMAIFYKKHIAKKNA
jgi:hypothetical protein